MRVLPFLPNSMFNKNQNNDRNKAQNGSDKNKSQNDSQNYGSR